MSSARPGCRRSCGGELVGAIAMTEPGAGSDLRGISTTAVLRRRSLRRQRHQDVHHERPPREPHLPRRPHRPRAPARRGISLLMVETDGLEGFTRGQAAAQARSARAGHLRAALQDCRVPVDCELGEGAGPLPPHAAAAVRAHRRRDHGGRGARARDRRHRRLRARAPRVRQAADGASEHPLQARRGAHGRDDRARLRRPLRRRA